MSVPDQPDTDVQSEPVPAPAQLPHLAAGNGASSGGAGNGASSGDGAANRAAGGGADGAMGSNDTSRPRRRSVLGSGPARNGASTGRNAVPTTARSWVARSEPERRSNPRLEFDTDGVVVLNDRRVPGSKLSIDLIAVSPAGVFVIDAKNYKGLVHTKRLGPVWDLGPHQLHIGRRNCTASVEKVAKKVEAVREVLRTTPWGREVPIRAVLCLTRAEWGYAAAVEVSDVLVGWPKLIAGKMKEPVVMDSSTVREVSEMIAERLPIA
jgi:hypothetical protein